MITGVYPVKRGDYLNGGRVSNKLKEILSKLGIASDIIRRIMIAVYEAEMNVIIHSNGGEILFEVDDEKIEVIVKDTGPGIPRIDLAIQEGYSTAPDEAREMGFGAGMGLPNIRKNSDYFTIHSEKSGTILRIRIFLKKGKDFSQIDSYVDINKEKCKKCLRCITACPTRAIRAYQDELYILSHHCINCNECIKICPTKVFDINKPEIKQDKKERKILIAPSPWISSILLSCQWTEFEEILKREENYDIYPLAIWEELLREKAKTYIRKNEKVNYPIILPVCPVVVYWIQTEYPALIEYIVPYLGPVETAINSFPEETSITVIPSCPAQVCEIYNNKTMDKMVDILTPQESMAMVRGITKEICDKKQSVGTPLNIKETIAPERIKITGVEQVRNFLEKLEKKQLPVPVQSVELYACYNGCFGSPFWREEPTISEIIFNTFWYQHKTKYINESFDTIFRVTPIQARKGIRLDEDVKKAIQKLSEIEKISKKLPGYDCGVCGAPSCLNFAEDIVNSQKSISRCPYLTQKNGDSL